MRKIACLNCNVDLTRNAEISIEGMFENGKPDIVLKTVKGFNKKRNLIIILIPENYFKWGIFALVMLNKMLVIVFTINFYSQYGLGF